MSISVTRRSKIDPYLRQLFIDKSDQLPHNEIQALIKRYQELDGEGNEANEILVTLRGNYLNYIAWIARRYPHRRADINDLISVGAYDGIKSAALKYDPSFRTDFKTVIFQEVRAVIQNEFFRQTGSDIEDHLDPKSSGVGYIRKNASYASSLDATSNTGFRRKDILKDGNDTPARIAEESNFIQFTLSHLKKMMHERDFQIFYLCVIEGLTEGKIGELFKINGRRIHELKNRILEKARMYMGKTKLGQMYRENYSPK